MTGSARSRGTLREEIAVPGLAPAISHYTDAVRFGDLLFVSGIIAVDKDLKLVGGDDVVQKIQEGWTDFEAVIATPDMMRSAGRLGKVLGPRGLMPNPKTGTVTFEIARAVKEIKAGKVEFRLDKTGIIHSPVGKISFSAEKLAGNAQALLAAVIKAKPAAAKGKYIRKITLTSTMGPGILIDHAEADESVAVAA